MLLSLAALAGCVTAVRFATTVSGFDHGAHAKRDVGCLDCHDQAGKAAKANLPTIDTCTQCHDGTKDSQASKQGLAAYKGAIAAKRLATQAVKGPTYSDVIFDHGKHAAAKVDCAACHSGATTGMSSNPNGPLAMNECIACHKERGAKTDCKTCHTEQSDERKPRNHDDAWKLRHGLVARAPDHSATLERCDLCHTRASCDSCHAENPPKDHTNPFRVSNHGLQAAMDRSRCLACHKADSCDRCHETEPPRTHRFGWGEPQDRHCITCHEPVSQESCGVCHKGTPAHQQAPPKPAGHVASSNCRQCHGNGAEFRHVDNGTDCNTCHH